MKDILIQEDLQTPESLCNYLEAKLSKQENCGLPKDVIDAFIAGFFCLADNSFVFPEETIDGASFRLHQFTQDQANLMVKTPNQKLTVLGPAGTGKTWMIIVAASKLYFSLKTMKKSGRILIVTVTCGIKSYIEDAVHKLISYESGATEDALGIEVRTLAEAKRKGNSETYCGIFIDECHNISSVDGEWLQRLWKDERHHDCSRFWMFGDVDQFMFGFKEGYDKENTIAAKSYESKEYHFLTQVVR